MHYLGVRNPGDSAPWSRCPALAPAYYRVAWMSTILKNYWLQGIYGMLHLRISRSVGRVGKCYGYGAVVKVCAGCGQVCLSIGCA